MQHRSDDMMEQQRYEGEGDASRTPTRRKKRFTLRSRSTTFATVAAVAAVLIVMLAMGRLDSLAYNFLETFRETPSLDQEPTVEVPSAGTETRALVFADLDIHPDVLFRPYTAGPVFSDNKGDVQARMIEQFRDLLAVYVQRQGIDDNFTVRVMDSRTGEDLEVFELEEQRRRYEATNEVNWATIDNLRRQETNRLVKKWVARGVPQPNVTVRWGRANQIAEARERNAPFIEHELNLARRLGLSLLAVQIPTVETFNQDRLISSVGARSRYQMMPYILRQNGIQHYNLRTAAGSSVQVFEEWHPLLTMEPAFITLKGYINAVGHEIPGISAYHTGPGNIYTVYRAFLSEMDRIDSETTVADAYLWAVTEGFDKVSRGTSFKTYSRGYVPSNYGALKATEDVPVDTTQTFLAERVQVRSDQTVFLSDLLEVLENDPQFMSVNRQLIARTDGPSELYNQFRELNPHIQLPSFSAEGHVPAAGDLRLEATSGNAPVRFFLPLGSMAALERAGRDVIDRSRSAVFDRSSFGVPESHEVTTYDREYDQLVQSIATFGFTNANRVELLRLVNQFERLAEENPSHYRRMQLAVIRTHAQIWQSGPWNRLAAEVSARRDVQRVSAQPPTALGSAAAAR